MRRDGKKVDLRGRVADRYGKRIKGVRREDVSSLLTSAGEKKQKEEISVTRATSSNDHIKGRLSSRRHEGGGEKAGST